MAEKVTITFNGKKLKVDPGEMVLTAVEKLGYEIPHYCFHEALSVAGSCRLCAIEVGYPDKDGNLKMAPPLVMSCQTPVKDGMVVLSESEKVVQHRKAAMEFLLINHPLDCPVCDQAGECNLQDYSFRYGHSVGRFENDEKFVPPKKLIGDNVVLYSTRCILCTRCVRFAREISGGAELAVVNRGCKNEIDVFPGKPLNDKMSGNVVDVCPVGAQLDRQFHFKQRVWFLSDADSICPRCSRGCNISIHYNKGVIWRIKPRKNSQVNGHWICNDGRYGFKYIHADQRLTTSQVRRSDKMVDLDGEETAQQARHLLGPFLNDEFPGNVAVVLSPAATCEEQFLLAQWARNAPDQVQLVPGPVFSEKEDQTFKNGFTINAEKVPNLKGLQKTIDHFGKPTMSFPELLKAIEKDKFGAIWIQGGYPWLNWCPTENLDILRKAPVLIVQDILAGEHTEKADLIIAGAAFAEKNGCFINNQDFCQNFDKAVDPPGDALDDIKFLWRFTGREETFDLQKLQKEMTKTLGLTVESDK
ncbi:MAG: molybdopterin-dependent oxidoreductase [Planctomycetes bacterium]|nr:molybdopterin-dependent oxidoreductase [Planctomycetota bacterium]